MLALDITKELVKRPSVTPNDEGCQDYLISLLEPLGFNCQTLVYGEVTNLWATRGSGAPLLVYLGHTDVVPTGEIDQWQTPPFEPTLVDQKLYGRGTADMKGSVACFHASLHAFLKNHSDHKGTIGVLITSDEEAIAIDGVKRVVEEHFIPNNIHIDYCLVGEPTSEKILGDTIKNGRRGSMDGHLTVYGKQGHIAYPHFSLNPVDLVAPLITELTQIEWDQGNDDFEPTGFQISNLQAGTGATNVIPGSVKMAFNFRYNTEHTDASLKAQIETIINKYGLTYDLQWKLSGPPYSVAKDGALVHACQNAGAKIFGITPMLSTSGGISDGRFIAPMGAETIEFGGLSTTIHQANEHIGLEELEKLSLVYENILEQLLCPS